MNLIMDIDALQQFIDVVRQGSFAAVARERNIDPSSVSRAIANLEKELQVRLFQRTTRKLSPTEAGSTYFERVESLVEELQEATAHIAETSGQPKGTLRVTTSVSFGQRCLIPLLPTFQTTYPDLNVDLLLTDAVVDIVTERIDIAIRLGILKDSNLIAQRLMQTFYQVCASPRYLQEHGFPEHPTEIEQHNCLLFPLPGFRTRWIFENGEGERYEVPVKGKTTISNAMALQQCAIAGMGLALLPHWITHTEIQLGHLINVFPDYTITATDFNTAAWLVYPSRTLIPLKVQVFIEWFKREVTPLSYRHSP
ncbi:MAG: LysR family transcriptional regulator [Cyanobacteria bacterium J06633_2]